MRANPDDWLAYAKAYEARKHYTLDHAHWVSVIICRAAAFVRHLRTGDWTPSTEISPEERGDPFSSIILFFIDAMRNDEVLAPRLKDILLEAITTCYRELGEHEGLKRQADDLCREFRTLVEACEHANDGCIARIRLAFVEKSYMEKHSRFFETIFRQKLPSTVTGIEIMKAYGDRMMDVMIADAPESLDHVIFKNVRSLSLFEGNAKVCLTVGNGGDVSLSIPYMDVIAQILNAAIFFRRRKGKRTVIGFDDGKGKPSVGADSAKGLASAFVGVVEATKAIDVSSAFYRGETKRKPATPLSVQVSPKANPTLPDLSCLLTPRPSDLTIAVFMDGMTRIVSASSAYFQALEKCARTPGLLTMTVQARDKFFMLCTYFASWYCLPADSPDRETLAEMIRSQFCALGECMEDLAGGFAEYEAQLIRQPPKRLSASERQAADKSGRKVTQKEAAEMIGISARELRNWNNGISRPPDFPGYENWTNLVKWLADPDNPYGAEWRATEAKKYRRRSPQGTVSYKEDWKPHQVRP